MAAAATSEAATFSGDDTQTSQLLLQWQRSGETLDRLRPRIIDLAVAYFARQQHLDATTLGRQVVPLGAADYATHSRSNCGDAANIHPSSEAWLMDIRQGTLYINDGFVAPDGMDATDLFFRYTIGLFNLAPKLRSYPNGVKSANGITAYYEKGLLLLGRGQTLDAVFDTNCYLEYRAPIQAAFTADLALKSLARLGLAPSPTLQYPQKADLDLFRAKLAPKLGSAVPGLVAPFMETQSGAFYQRVGEALGQTGSPAAREAAADNLFRHVFPAS
ncbi:MAG TPA: hypothetical protein VMV93_00150 [Chloroflexota bacterium]|nr:hypothetical protein [Chloroflexota bacterium]